MLAGETQQRAHRAVLLAQVPDYELQSVYELPLVLLLGALCGLVSTTFQGACKVCAYPSCACAHARAPAPHADSLRRAWSRWHSAPILYDAAAARAWQWACLPAANRGVPLRGQMSESAFQALGQGSFTAGREASAGAAPQQAGSSTHAALLPAVLLPTVGGLATGMVALYYPEVLYQGFGESATHHTRLSVLLSPLAALRPTCSQPCFLVEVPLICVGDLAGNVNAILQARTADYAPVLLLEIVVAKIATTAVCRGSGLVGGIYAPSIFIGMVPLHFLPTLACRCLLSDAKSACWSCRRCAGVCVWRTGGGSLHAIRATGGCAAGVCADRRGWHAGGQLSGAPAAAGAGRSTWVQPSARHAAPSCMPACLALRSQQMWWC